MRIETRPGGKRGSRLGPRWGKGFGEAEAWSKRSVLVEALVETLAGRIDS